MFVVQDTTQAGASLTELDVQMEVERLMVKEFATELYGQSDGPDVLDLTTDQQIPKSAKQNGKKKRKTKPKYVR